jgi:hypothetical protein
LLCPSRLHLSSFIFTLKQEKLASHMIFTRREKLTSVEELTPSLLIKEGITLLSLSKSQPQVHCKYDCLSNHFLFFFFLLVTLQHLNLFIYLFIYLSNIGSNHLSFLLFIYEWNDSILIATQIAIMHYMFLSHGTKLNSISYQLDDGGN